MSEEKLVRASIVLHAVPSSRPSTLAAPDLSSPLVAGAASAGGRIDSLALLEHRLALLHGTEGALVTASRLGALALVASHLMTAGDNLVCADQICGETHAFFDTTCADLGYDVRFVSSPWELDRWEDQIDERTQLLFVECPSDPNMFVPDLERLSALAGDHCIPLVVDTTVGTPMLCPASQWGADLVLTSLAGDLSGHALATGGAVMGKAETMASLREVARRVCGDRLHPLVAALVLLGLETLWDRLRTKRENTLAVRSLLLEKRAEGEVAFVNHPSLRKHPQYGLSRKYTDGFAGALISFGIRGGEDRASQFIDALQMITTAGHPGGNRTTIAHPYSSTHADLSPAQKDAAVIRPAVLRLCIGNEDITNILDDLERGFAAI